MPQLLLTHSGRCQRGCNPSQSLNWSKRGLASGFVNMLVTLDVEVARTMGASSSSTRNMDVFDVSVVGVISGEKTGGVAIAVKG